MYSVIVSGMQNFNDNEGMPYKSANNKKEFLKHMKEAKLNSEAEKANLNCHADDNKDRRQGKSKLKARYVKEFTEYENRKPIDFTLYKIVNQSERETMYVAYETDFLDKFEMYTLPTIWGDIPIED